MKQVNLTLFLITAFCLILFASFAQAQTESAEPNEAAKADSNEIELARQKNRLELQEQREIKKWRELKPGMTEKQVQKLLGRPQLIQGGSDECIWFYQDLPVSNVENVEYGIVCFEAKSVESLTAEEGAKRKQAIEEAEAQRNKAIAKEHEDYEKLIEKRREKAIATRKVPKRRGTTVIIHRTPESDKATATPKVPKPSTPMVVHKRSKPTVSRNAPKRDLAERRDKLIKRKETRYETYVKRAEDNYNTQVKRLTLAPRSPVFILKSFNQPDWDRCEDILAKRRPLRIGERPTEEWKMPLRWRKLKINMTVKQVHVLLGDPERTKTNVQGRKEYYGNVPGHGELLFASRSDLKEYLDSWVEPFWPAVERQSLQDLNEPSNRPESEGKEDSIDSKCAGIVEEE